MKKALVLLILVIGGILAWTVISRDRSAFPTEGATYIAHLAVSPNGLLFAATTDTRVYIWTTADRRQVTEIRRGEGYHALAWSPDSQRIAIDGPDSTVDVYDPTTGRHLGSFTNPDRKWGPIFDLAWSTQDQIAIAYDNNQVAVLDGAMYQIRYSFVLPAPIGDYPWTVIHDVTFTGDGTLLAAGSSDGHLRLWQMADGRLVHDIVLQRHQGALALAFNPTGTLLASGGMDGGIDLWDVATGHLQVTLTGHSAPISALAFLPDGRRLVSGADPIPDSGIGSPDPTIRLWDVTTQQFITIIGNHRSHVWEVTVSPDGQSILSSGPGDGIKLWTLP